MTDERPAEAEALARYRAASRRRGGAIGSGRRRSAMRNLGQTRSGPRPDARDPQLLGDVWRSLTDGLGWTNEMALWSLTNRWAEIVGPQVAEHVAVVEFDPTPGAPADGAHGGGDQQGVLVGEAPPADAEPSGGKLTLMADSHSWQQQMIWNLVHLQRRLDQDLGAGVVGRIVVQGPPSGRRKFGERRVTN